MQDFKNKILLKMFLGSAPFYNDISWISNQHFCKKYHFYISLYKLILRILTSKQNIY